LRFANAAGSRAESAHCHQSKLQNARAVVIQHSRKAQRAAASERAREKEGERMEIEGKERRGYIFEWVLLPL
jgi:hypothetical protein